MSFGPLTGDSKAIKEDQSISLLYTLALTGTTPRRRIRWFRKKKVVCDYALAWMSLARAFSLTKVKH